MALDGLTPPDKLETFCYGPTTITHPGHFILKLLECPIRSTLAFLSIPSPDSRHASVPRMSIKTTDAFSSLAAGRVGAVKGKDVELGQDPVVIGRPEAPPVW